MHQAGSTAAAGKALQELLQRAGAPADSALQGWAKALSKPERAGGAFGARSARLRVGCEALRSLKSVMNLIVAV